MHPLFQESRPGLGKAHSRPGKPCIVSELIEPRSVFNQRLDLVLCRTSDSPHKLMPHLRQQFPFLTGASSAEALLRVLVSRLARVGISDACI
jgi:hypothetical protein